MHYKLESLRGVASCLVVIFHSNFIVFDNPVLFIQNSWLFVDFFFILSGFVMSTAYGDKIGANSTINFDSYIFLRLARLYPLHIFMLFVWLAYIVLDRYLCSLNVECSGRFMKNDISSFISNIFLFQTMGTHDYLTWNKPSWSISAEFYTYIYFYFFTVIFDNKKSLITPIIVSALGYFFLFSMMKSSSGLAGFAHEFGLVRCIAAFYLGVAAFRLKPILFKVTSDKLLPALELTVILIMVSLVTYNHTSRILLILCLSVFSLAVIIFSAEKNGYIGKILLLKPFRKIGLWSYSIYMVHWLVLSIVNRFTIEFFKIDSYQVTGLYALIMNIVCLAITIFISRFTYIHIEDRLRNRAKSILKKRASVLQNTN